MSCDHAHLDGAYVLGALSPTERTAFERHLSECAECTQRVGDLAGLPGLLARVPADVLEPDHPEEPVPPTLLPSLVGAVRRDQRRRTTRVALLVAAAAVVVGGSAAVAVAGLGDGDDGGGATVSPPTAVRTAPGEAMDQVGQDAVTGSLSLTGVAWGTRLDLECSYADVEWAEDWAAYALVVRTTDGRVEQVATWRGLPGESMRLSGATAAKPTEIASVEVRTADGRPVLRLAG